MMLTECNSGEDTPSEYEYEQYFGNGEISLSFTSSKAYSTTIEKQSSYATSTTEEQYHEGSGSLKIETVFKSPISSAHTTLTVELGYRGGWNKSDSDTWTNSYSKAEAFSTNNTKTVSFAFDSSSKHGYYRYILFGTIDVYVVVMFDPSIETFYLDSISSVTAQGWGLDYSASSTFDDYVIDKLPLDMSILDTLGYKPETEYQTDGIDSVDTTDPANNNSKIQIDAGDAHSLMIDYDGNLWAWGANRWGRLGDGTTNDKFTSVQIFVGM